MGNSVAMGLETLVHASLLYQLFSVESYFHQPSIRTFLAAMIIFANIPPMQDARVPIQADGLAFAATG